MNLKPLLLFWAFVLPSLADSTIGSIFTIRTDTNDSGGCKSRLALLETWLDECKQMVQAAMDVFQDASDSSNANHRVAKDYLKTYFWLDDNSLNEDINVVKNYLQNVYNFLHGQTKPGTKTPGLFCSDTWLDKLSRTDVAYDGDSSKELKYFDANGALYLVAIEDVPDYESELYIIHEDGSHESNGYVPYWSDDLTEYVFDQDYGGLTFCTAARGENLGATQEQTIPSTVTLCPDTFTNTENTPKLGSKSPKSQTIGKAAPRSATLYHEIFHLVMGNEKTPDYTYFFHVQAERLKSPDTNYVDEDGNDWGKTNSQLTRMNPETYVWFSVGYWYFQQTKWSSESNQRYSFHTGKARLVQV